MEKIRNKVDVISGKGELVKSNIVANLVIALL